MKTTFFGRIRAMAGGPRRQRSGMTLIEILIAMGILAIGMMGILTLFPLAIRNISIAVNRTMGAAVAKNAIASLSMYAVDLSRLDASFPPVVIGEVAADGTNNGSNVLLEGVGGNMSWAIYAYHTDNPPGIGHGVPRRSFQMPDDLANADAVGRDFDGKPGVDAVTVPWHTDFGWTATFLPMPVNDDPGNDDLADEDPVDGIDNDGDLSTDEDDVNITPTTIYAVQVAVWRNYRLIYPAAAAPTGTFKSGESEVSILGADAEFWTKVKPGDFIRHKDHGIWYQIAELSGGSVFLAGEFSHPVDSISGDVEVASRFRLVAIYDSAVGGSE